MADVHTNQAAWHNVDQWKLNSIVCELIIYVHDRYTCQI